MFKVLNITLTTVLILFVLVSSVGFTINKHHCNSKNKTSYSVAVIGLSSKSCCSNQVAKKSCCKKKVKSSCQLKKKCCSDDTQTLLLDQEYETSTQSIPKASEHSLSPLSVLPSNSLIEFSKIHSFGEFNLPPSTLIVRKTIVLVQSFLL